MVQKAREHIIDEMLHARAVITPVENQRAANVLLKRLNAIFVLKKKKSVHLGAAHWNWWNFLRGKSP